jgi:3-phenylpropionate/trans-cinnamate dioxygenase ferredoxin subunit
MALKIRWYKVYDFAKHGNMPQQPNTVRTIDVEGTYISFCFDGNNYFGLADRCPHAGAKFGMGGWCESGMMVCPVHRYKYDLTSGRGKQGDYIKTYDGKLESDGVYIALKKEVNWWWPF